MKTKIFCDIAELGLIKKFNNRMYGKIGIVPMDRWKSFEIDSIDDFKLCSLVMKEYMLKK